MTNGSVEGRRTEVHPVDRALLGVAPAYHAGSTCDSTRPSPPPAVVEFTAVCPEGHEAEWEGRRTTDDLSVSAPLCLSCPAERAVPLTAEGARFRKDPSPERSPS